MLGPSASPDDVMTRFVPTKVFLKPGALPGALGAGPLSQSPPCFYSSPEGTNLTLGLDKDFHVLHFEQPG